MWNQSSTLIYVILGCLVFIIVSVYLVYTITSHDIIQPDEEEKLRLLADMAAKNKRYCTTEVTYCFTDQDCSSRCDISNKYACINGICKNQRIVEQNPKNDCDPTKGFVAYLVGNPAFGQYDYICKSIDPGIAINLEKNLMCYGEKIDFNYIYKFPSTQDCSDCPYPAVVPATSVKREHLECSEQFWYLVQVGYN